MPPYGRSMPSTTASHAPYVPPPPPATSGVQVMVRVRPPLPREFMFDSGVETKPPYDIKVFNGAQEFSGRYHYAFGEDSTQGDVYEKVRDCVPLALAGYNSTIFAYGQTGTGKTFTMMGDDPSMDREVDNPGLAIGSGIIPRAVKELFREAKAKQDAEGAAIQVIVSYMEIYNDRLHDLLQPYKPHSTKDPADMNQKRALLEVREDARGHTYVPNLLCVKVKSYKSVYQLIAKGNRNRAVRHTEMNQASSRSHAILQIVLEQWPNGGADGTVIRSKLNFVDLAGSERWNTNAQAWDGGPDLMGSERVTEMTAINGSLSALGSVVAALTEKRPHVPYRDSRLTHLLQDSLGGNCRTTVLATLSPSQDAFEESCSTLRFADRARAIANNPVVNSSRDVGSILALKEREIQRLRNMLTQYANGAVPGTEGAEAQAAAKKLAEELDATRRALEMERALRTELQQRLHHNAGSGGGAGGGGPDGAAGANPATAFDAAGTVPPPIVMRAGSLRSSASGSGGSAGQFQYYHQPEGGGHAPAPGQPGGPGADFFRLSTPSTPLNAVPQHLLGAPPGSDMASPSPYLKSGPRNSASRSRSTLRSQGAAPGGGAGGGGGGLAGPGRPGPAPGSPGGLMRRLSFDEAIMSIKSQVINLSAQERQRLKARQPPTQPWAGRGPRSPNSHQAGGHGAGVSPAAAASAAAMSAAAAAAAAAAVAAATGNEPKSYATRTKQAAAIYGASPSPKPKGGKPPLHSGQPYPQPRRGAPPPLTVAPGIVSSSLNGGNSLPLIHSLEMTDSPVGSDVISPGDHTLIHRQQGFGGNSLAMAYGPPPPHQQSSLMAAYGGGPPQPPQQRLPPPAPSPVGSKSKGPAAGAGVAAVKQAANGGYGRDAGAAYGAAAGGGGGPVAKRSRAGDGEAEAAGRQGRQAQKAAAAARAAEEEEEDDEDDDDDSSDDDSDDDSSDDDSDDDDDDDDDDEEDEGVEEEEGAAASPAAAAAAARSAAAETTGDSADLEHLDPDEYEALMAQAREALAAHTAKQGAAGGGGGRSAMAGGQPSSAPAQVAGPGIGLRDAAAAAAASSGWGRNALLHKFTDAEPSPGGGYPPPPSSGGAGGGGYGRSALQGGPPPASPGPLGQPASAPAAPGGGGWGRKSIVAGPPKTADGGAEAASPPRQQPGGAVGRKALVAELLAEPDVSPMRRRQAMPAPGGKGGPGKGRSKSVGGARGRSTDAVAKLGVGSWVYILGASASSTRAKQLAAALQMDVRTGLPALH
ncbi:hypothetical protein HYH03_004815 [Edaphochlamys debaryana]|uniref:Kinesin motor domain-containing protein n=1 Tax=Edaphochlamys debaryana TaxID=47281 RepID=A0A835YAG5_9CHLO|nr:hypothetical protein HYH03_004815 [Edaphochlamys debaryana]|eukprot:KAG2497226.1 hypothetical protein HYH03_004815 [Edaphochlamys debaryana]